MDDSRLGAQLFRRPRHSVAAPGSGAAVPSSHQTLTARTRECIFRALVVFFSLLDSVRSQPLMWFVLSTALLSAWIPLPDVMSSAPVIISVAWVSLFLSGAAFPDFSSFRPRDHMKYVVIVLFSSFVCAPFLWWALSLVVTRVFLVDGELLSLGCACIGVLPTSFLVAVLQARDYQGSEHTAKIVTAASSLISVLISPFTMTALVRPSSHGNVVVAKSSSIVNFACGCLLSFSLGVMVQQALLWCVGGRGRSGDKDDEGDLAMVGDRAVEGEAPAVVASPHASSLISLASPSATTSAPNAASAFTDPPAESVPHRWRRWALRLNSNLYLITVYLLFSAVRRIGPSGDGRDASGNTAQRHVQGTLDSAPSVSPPPSSSSQPPVSPLFPVMGATEVFALVVIETAALAVTTAAAWAVTMCGPDSPDDRVSLAFAAALKSDVMILPVLMTAFPDAEVARRLAVPAAVFVVLQSIGGAICASMLRRWRNSVNCRPGTTLLPLRLSQYSRASSPQQ